MTDTVASADTATFRVSTGEEISLPVIAGSLGARGADVTKLLSKTGVITYDPGYGSTGSCNAALDQCFPASVLTSTRSIFPRPLQAMPLISIQPFSTRCG